jgi:hypothetical protein
MSSIANAVISNIYLRNRILPYICVRPAIEVMYHCLWRTPSHSDEESTLRLASGFNMKRKIISLSTFTIGLDGMRLLSSRPELSEQR